MTSESNQQTLFMLGTRTLGRAIAVHFAQKGFRVVCASRTRESVDALADEVTKVGGTGVPVVCDITDPQSLARSVESVGRIDLCIAAQTAGGRFGARPLLELEADELLRGFNSYLHGTWNLLRAVGPALLRQGSGTFLQIGTSSGVRTKDGYAALAANQHGLRALIQVAAREWRNHGVHVAYLPIDGGIESDKTRAWVEKRGKENAIPQSAIVDACDFLHSQDPRGWTHELLIRPPGNTWTAPT